MRKFYFIATLRSGGLVASVAALFSAPPLQAQQAEKLVKIIGISSLFDFSAETRLGAVTPRRANTGIEGAFEWTVGSLGASWLRPMFGADLFQSDIRRGVGDVPVNGSITGADILAGMRFDANADGAVSPYLVGGLSAGYQWTTASDSATARDLKGAGPFGLALGGGLAAWLGTSPYALTGDVRHVFSGDKSRTTYAVGVRVQPRISQMRRQLHEKVARVKDALDELIRAHESLPDAM
jgi:hypothetical protein